MPYEPQAVFVARLHSSRLHRHVGDLRDSTNLNKLRDLYQIRNRGTECFHPDHFAGGLVSLVRHQNLEVDFCLCAALHHQSVILLHHVKDEVSVDWFALLLLRLKFSLHSIQLQS